jgi:CCR4-NOT transcription complex subunit 1
MYLWFLSFVQVIYSDEERRYNREITVGLIRSELINLSDYNVQLTKLIDGGRNSKPLKSLS